MLDSLCLDVDFGLQTYNINSNATSAIGDSLFRLVRDGSALRGPVRDIGALRERLESKRLFMLLDRSRRGFSVLYANRSICVA